MPGLGKGKPRCGMGIRGRGAMLNTVLEGARQVRPARCEWRDGGGGREKGMGSGRVKKLMVDLKTLSCLIPLSKLTIKFIYELIYSTYFTAADIIQKNI